MFSLSDLLQKITLICKFHSYAVIVNLMFGYLPECLSGLVNEGLMIGDHIRVFDTSEDSDFINGVKAIFFLHFGNLNFLLSIELSVFLSLDQKNLAI